MSVSYSAQRKRIKAASDPGYHLRQREAMRRSRERCALKIAAEIIEGEHWPLRQGWQAAERGCKSDPSQCAEWLLGWRMFHRDRS